MVKQDEASHCQKGLNLCIFDKHFAHLSTCDIATRQKMTQDRETESDICAMTLMLWQTMTRCFHGGIFGLVYLARIKEGATDIKSNATNLRGVI